MRILAFHGTGNLGDLTQTVALSRLVGKATAVFRDQPHLNRSEDDLLIAAGFFLGPIRQDSSKILFAGVYYPAFHGPHNFWVSRSPFPVGARDPETCLNLKKAGIPCEMVGCVTLTLPRYTGPRSGSIDVDTERAGLTNKITGLRFRDEWDLCLKRLDLYRHSALVRTTRIHVAMPAIAMGTPVVYTGPMAGRAGVLGEIGVRWGRESLPDVGSFSDRYMEFIERHSGIRCLSGDPVIPEAPEEA